ncbi:hypothetical protein [Alcanivorax sp. DP30]|uniref:hypothetical protein n=1 Tax=Alcanivorax sp. DP30 TaxID=2606217 RepID=UPI00136FFD70|nr:hypothetical protein [Alcanivorax sp. DP30]MZR63819.1 hypothetical protein [Alcanivorax sp. DP30]
MSDCKSYLYHWAVMMGDGISHEYRDGTASWGCPINTPDEYAALKKKLQEELGATNKRFNVLSLSFLHSRPTTGDDKDE